ncbi:hypothetical protein TNCV_4170441 [Trichonephila clavipes]|nr:hypothetical protein TNCV_4170441 [Trichonephila clavipes]
MISIGKSGRWSPPRDRFCVRELKTSQRPRCFACLSQEEQRPQQGSSSERAGEDSRVADFQDQRFPRPVRSERMRTHGNVPTKPNFL